MGSQHDRANERRAQRRADAIREHEAREVPSKKREFTWHGRGTPERVNVGQINVKKEEIRMTDPTESIRREMVAEINAEPGSRAALKPSMARSGYDQLQRDFEALGFMAPLVVVRRRSDGVKGSLMFQHDPRFYFGFQPE